MPKLILIGQMICYLTVTGMLYWKIVILGTNVTVHVRDGKLYSKGYPASEEKFTMADKELNSSNVHAKKGGCIQEG